MPGSLRIIFMGTPQFAVASLKMLHQSQHKIMAVVTVADKRAGRGQQLQESAVKKFAMENGLKILQPLKLKDPAFIEELQSLQADLFVVVAFRMLPEVIWQMPSMGTINVHASLLPAYRGAAPINHAIINGEKETGVTTFFLRHEIDTGDVIMQEKLSIGENETAGELHDRMMILGAETLLKTVDRIATGDAKRISQEQLNLGKTNPEAPKLSKEFGKIDWHKTVSEIHNKVRGLSPYPAAWTFFQGKSMKVFMGEKTSIKSTTPGEISTDGKTFLRISAADFQYELTDIQLEGKKRMKIEEFLRGTKL